MAVRVIFYILPFIFVSCADNPSGSSALGARADAPEDSLAVKVAVTPTLDCLPLFVASEEGMFDAAGITVRLCMFQAQMDQDTAFVRKHVEGMTTDSVRASYLRVHEGVALRQLAATSLRWQLLANKTARIRQLSQLYDKMIAMTRHSATSHLASKAVAMAGISAEHVFFIQINDLAVRLGMLENDVMDAMFLPEPQATQARMSGHNVLLDTDSLDFHPGVLVFREDALADTACLHRIETLVKVYRQACDSVEKHGLSHYRNIVSAYCNIRPEVVDSVGK